MKWYALRIATNKENKVKELVEKQIEIYNLEKYFDQVLIPKEVIYKVKNNKRVKTEKSYLPGYVLIKADLIGEMAHLIKKVKGVHGFLGDDNPTALRETEMARILGKMDDVESSVEVIDDLFLVGEKLKIIQGSFNTFIGEVNKIDMERKRITLTVKIFNRDTPVEVNLVDVERI